MVGFYEMADAATFSNLSAWLQKAVSSVTQCGKLHILWTSNKGDRILKQLHHKLIDN